MINKISNEQEYNQVMLLIATVIKKLTDNGGFSSLSVLESEELSRLSLLAEQYEDDYLEIMPLKGI